MADIWRHKKSGAFYEKLSHAIDATNSRNGTRVIVYCHVEAGGIPQFVREQTEFEDKFERVCAVSAGDANG